MRWNLSSRGRELSDGDAILISIPKSGRTWVRTFLNAYFPTNWAGHFLLIWPTVATLEFRTLFTRTIVSRIEPKAMPGTDYAGNTWFRVAPSAKGRSFCWHAIRGMLSSPTSSNSRDAIPPPPTRSGKCRWTHFCAIRALGSLWWSKYWTAGSRNSATDPISQSCVTRIYAQSRRAISRITPRNWREADRRECLRLRRSIFPIFEICRN
jgi:hypothetical protein